MVNYFNPDLDYSLAIQQAIEAHAPDATIAQLKQERQNKINALYNGKDPHKSIVPSVNPSHYVPSIRAYSLARDGSRNITPHFLISEFACQDGSDPIMIAEMLPLVLENIREHFGKTRITSAFRTAQHNANVGGSRYSQHQYGCAADIIVEGVAPKDVADYARSIMPNFGGVGRYPTFTHVDVRTAISNWNGR